MSSNLNKKYNEQNKYNFVYSPVNINNKIGLKKDVENPKSNEQLGKYYFQNISTQSKNYNKNINIQSTKDSQKIAASPNNQYYYKSKIQRDNNINNINHSKNFNETKNSKQSSRSPISLTGRITNLNNIKLNRDKNEEEKKKYKGSNINLNNYNENKLIRSSYLINHNSKSVNSNNNKYLKYGNNLIIKTANITEGLNKLRNDNIYGGKKSNYNFNNNNHGIMNNMNNNTSKNKKKNNEISNNSNLNIGMLSFSTSNISVNNLIPVNNQNISNNDSTNNLNVNNNINVIKNISEDEQNKNNLNLCLDNISNTTKNNNNIKTKPNSDTNKNNNKINIQTKSAEQTTRNPKYFKNESIYNTNYIINFIDSNEIKNGKLDNQIYIIGQKDIKKNNANNAYKELTDITKNNVNEILSKKNEKFEEKKNSENSFIKKYFDFSEGYKYKNPEELHFSMVKISQNINNLNGKF